MSKTVSSKIAAGIVLYNPDIKLLKEDIDLIKNQVDKVCLFDNNSSNIKEIKEAFSNCKYINLISENKNKGIAYGLNQLLNWADQNKYEWLLTLDQDSRCASNLIEVYSEYLDQERIALICPFIINNGKYSLKEYQELKKAPTTEVVDPIDCITSACLTNVKIVKKIGGYTDKLFIDYVDTDLNCKVLANNYRILRANETYMIQQMGKGKKIKLFSFLHKLTKLNIFRRLKVVAIYTDQRLYYSARNSRYVRKNYKNHGFQTSALFMLMFYSYFTLFYPINRSRIKMWKSIIRGFKDYESL